MEYLIYVYLIMVGAFFSYVGYIWSKFGILPSISDSWYVLPEKQRPLFTFFCWGFALPAAIIGFTISDGSPFQFLMFFASGGIMFVGVAPDFKKGLDKIIHAVAALTGVIASAAYLLFVFPEMWYVPVGFILGSLLLYLYRQRLKEIWWIEILSFISFAIVSGVQICLSLS